ncbi:MAG: hypothetical protein AMQ22_00717 [Candidatus Methanofastidiosum methylothiophilum]|uniref:Peptidase S74 domain-containing protein n=1 Tax=Candidatus Methanofastidiosum methylothiophilum TaxID=1705564 RepID=A0A150J5Z7_9EURY|nr:MAG: hypothetical protein AMQ22_00717 [Candidatus Methanofastidiosum methylthiophilus]
MERPDGVGTLQSNTTSSNNTAIGHSVLNMNTSGIGNTGIGSGTLSANNTGQNNTATGYLSLAVNTSGSKNTAYGVSSGGGCMVGTDNTYIGYLAGKLSTSSFNTTLGSLSGELLTSGGNNVLLGYGAGRSLTTQGGNVFIGHQAGYSSTDTNTLIIANADTATPLIKGDFATNTGTFYGIWSYNSHPTFTSDTQLVDKKYVDDLAGAQTPITEELVIDSDGKTSFTLAQTPHTAAYVNAYLRGQRRRYNVDFTVSGTTLTWNDPGGLTLLITDSPLIVTYEY